MGRNNSRQSIKLKTYRQKNNLSTLIWFLTGAGVLVFGIYFKEIFEIIGGIFLMLIAIIKFITRKINKIYTIFKQEREKLKYLLIVILAFSLINPIGILGPIFDIVKRDWVLGGGLDE